jgi:hypothetical protein
MYEHYTRTNKHSDESNVCLPFSMGPMLEKKWYAEHGRDGESDLRTRRKVLFLYRLGSSVVAGSVLYDKAHLDQFGTQRQPEGSASVVHSDLVSDLSTDFFS